MSPVRRVRPLNNEKTGAYPACFFTYTQTRRLNDLKVESVSVAGEEVACRKRGRQGGYRMVFGVTTRRAPT